MASPPVTLLDAYAVIRSTPPSVAPAMCICHIRYWDPCCSASEIIVKNEHNIYPLYGRCPDELNAKYNANENYEAFIRWISAVGARADRSKRVAYEATEYFT